MYFCFKYKFFFRTTSSTYTGQRERKDGVSEYLNKSQLNNVFFKYRAVKTKFSRRPRLDVRTYVQRGQYTVYINQRRLYVDGPQQWMLHIRVLIDKNYYEDKHTKHSYVRFSQMSTLWSRKLSVTQKHKTSVRLKAVSHRILPKIKKKVVIHVNNACSPLSWSTGLSWWTWCNAWVSYWLIDWLIGWLIWLMRQTWWISRRAALNVRWRPYIITFSTSK